MSSFFFSADDEPAPGDSLFTVMMGMTPEECEALGPVDEGGAEQDES